jgi:hypothetical protein
LNSQEQAPEFFASRRWFLQVQACQAPAVRPAIPTADAVERLEVEIREIRGLVLNLRDPRPGISARSRAAACSASVPPSNIAGVIAAIISFSSANWFAFSRDFGG